MCNMSSKRDGWKLKLFDWACASLADVVEHNSILNGVPVCGQTRLLQQQREKGERLAGPNATPLQQLRSFAHGHVSVIVNRPAGRMIVSHLELLASHQKSTELLQKQDDYVRVIIKRAVDAGELREFAPVIASAVLFGTLNTVPRTFDPDGRLSLEEVVDAVLDLLLQGWKPFDVERSRL